jgi:arginine deiminase
MLFGCQSMVGRIRRILLKHAKDAFVSPSRVDEQWKRLDYLAPPAFEAAFAEYERLLSILKDHVDEIHFLPMKDSVGMDSIYVHDPVIVTDGGAVLCRMGKELRRSESDAIHECLDTIGVDILGEITGDGTLEGGDVVWIDRRTLAVGRGGRTNAEGIRQLRKICDGLIDELIEVPLPDGIMHLMSLMSLIDDDLAIIHGPLLPVTFRRWLESRGIALIEVPLDEYDNQAANILALDRRKCLMISGNNMTRTLLESAGAHVIEFDGREIAVKGEGGPTCLTRPLLRDY